MVHMDHQVNLKMNENNELVYNTIWNVKKI